jgi:tRNA pseudouridine55 synthase
VDGAGAPSGGLLLDKPSGITSARAVARVKRLLPRKTKVGHTGTLDPLASGLLVLLIGRSTRLSRYVTALDKSYTATAALGAHSDTLDAEGEISPHPGPTPTENDLRAALREFIGTLEQIPPMASAVKQGGRRLYDLHRQGITVEREPRGVEITSFTLTDFDAHRKTATFSVRCSSGTYVRTLISDLVASLGSAAYLTALRRTSVGHLAVEQAITLEDLTASTINQHIIPPTEVLHHLPVLEVGEDEARAARHGGAIRGRGFEESFGAVYEGELLGVYREDSGVARPEVVLWG